MPQPMRAALPKHAASPSADVKIEWRKEICELKTIPTLQLVVNPLIERSSPIHDQVFKSLADLHAQHIRFVPWLPYPKLGVAELEPLNGTKTSWNFTLLDPLMEDFMAAAGNGSVIINFSTPPQWLYNTSDWTYPADQDDVTWSYEKGTELRDKTAKQFAEYYKRLLSHYTKGGFTDEDGVFHASKYNYKIQTWEVLNEVEAEHSLTPELYSIQYDAVVAEMQKLDPSLEFVGLALAYHKEWNWYNYFLNASNHQSGIPLDWISYHFYASSQTRYTPTDFEEFFPAADGFVSEVAEIEKIRKSLSPKTRTTIDEVGVILPDDNTPHPDPPASYWAAAAGMYAYLFMQLSQQEIDVLGESQLVGYPQLDKLAPQFPSVSMVDWNTGYGNPRYWMLKTLLDQIGQDKHKIVKTESSSPDVAAQAFERKDGSRWMMLVNKRFASISVNLPSRVESYKIVGESTQGANGPKMVKVDSQNANLSLLLQPFETAVINLQRN